MNRSLILTANYAARTLELPGVFLRSLQATGSHAEVVLISNHGSRADEMRLHELMPNAKIWLPIPKTRYRALRRLAKTFPRLAKSLAGQLRDQWRRYPQRKLQIEYWAAHLLNITCSRYLLARRFLATVDRDFEHVMLADSRDVLFQSNPFAGLPSGLTTGLESVLVSNEPNNVRWLQHLYSDDAKFPMNEVLGQPVVCSGVTLGETAAVEHYLEQMCAEFMRLLPRMVHEPYLDQGVHIGLMRSERSQHVNLVPNGQPWIATVGTSDLSEFRIADKRLLTHDGSTIRIVHQYDRHPGLAAMLSESLSATNSAG